VTAFLLNLPKPPSTNRLFGVSRGRRRYKTAEYSAWIDLAGREILAHRPRPKPIEDKFRIYVTCGPIRGDPDNLMKPTLDLLVAHGLIRDDRAAYAVWSSVEVLQEHDKHRITISVEEMK
jgi:Holliday junction resolvase RusA-like endonuclease